MDLATETVDPAEFALHPWRASSFHSNDKVASHADKLQSLTDLFVMKLENLVRRDDRVKFLTESRQLLKGDTVMDRTLASKLLHACCESDAVECATALLDGELGTEPVVNEVDSSTGRSPLHSASESHARRCIELLLKRRARTDQRSRDGGAQLALELSLNSTRMGIIWNPDDYSVEDLVVLLGEKDLTAVKLLSEKTKEIGEVAYGSAIGGRIVALAALLIVAADKVNEAILTVHSADSGCKEKATVYECVIREALSMGCDMLAKRAGGPTEAELAHKRKLLLCEIELLQLFGAIAYSSATSTERKQPPPLIRAIKAGDEAVIELLLKTNNVNDPDADGNSALHWSLKTSWSSTSQQLKIMWLLFKHGARVNQKNKLGFSAFHIAASKGNSQALQALLLEDSDGINYKTIMKETPIFFAVKNDHIECVELLLYWGANSEIFNLRKERPMDLAKSQDMRFMLNPTNIKFVRSACPVQHMCAAQLQCDDDGASEALVSTTEDSSMDRHCLGSKAQVCKYFEGPGGCLRGSNCSYAHGKEEHKKMNQGMHIIQGPGTVEFRRKIFVGGVPPSLDSDSLRKFFEEQFGSVEFANILKVQIGNEMQSRGFGFVTFKNEMSASEAVKAHYVTIMGKQVEIKSAFRKYFFMDKPPKLSSDQDVQEDNDQWLQKMEASNPGEEMPRSTEAAEDTKNKQTPWMDTLLNGISKSSSGEAESHVGPCSMHQKSPAWLTTFRKWLPTFLKEATKNSDGVRYPLSSLKTDFRAAFGQELDHASLGYPKLSDFIKEFPDLCRVEFMPVGSRGPSNHMVLFPPQSRSSCPLLRSPLTKSPSCDKSASDTDGSKCMEGLHPTSLGNLNTSSENSHKLKLSLDIPQNNLGLEDTSFTVHPKFSQLLQPDQTFQPQPKESAEAKSIEGSRHGGPKDGIKGKEVGNELSHLVLEAHSGMRNKSSFFLREFDFYHTYRTTIERGNCFWCKQRKLVWANFPCRHVLWCSDCKMKAVQAASDSAHKCVVCDVKVDKFILVPSVGRFQPWHGNFRDHVELPPFQPSHTFRTEVVG